MHLGSEVGMSWNRWDPRVATLALLACQSGGARTAANTELNGYLSDYAPLYQRLNHWT
jgi:hypothetical protein